MAAPRAASAPARLLLTAAVATAILHTVAAMGACGTSPKVIHVSKGDKKRVRFWNTEAVGSPLSGEELAEGSGQEPPVEPELEPLATLVAAGVNSATAKPPLGAAETTPFVVTPAGPEATTESSEPLYDTQPHIVLPEPQQDTGDRVVSSPVTQDTSAGASPVADATTPEEIVKAEHTKAEAEISNVSVESTEHIVPGQESVVADEGSGEDITTTTEREYLTTFDPYDLVAIANGDVETNNLQKGIPPEPEASAHHLEGSGDNITVPASATIPLNKYQEINISSDSADTEVAEVADSHFTSDSVNQGTTVMLEENSSEQAVGEDRLISVTGFSGDKVLVEWTPDEEASGNTEVENDAEGSGTMEEGVAVTFSSQAETGAVSDDRVGSYSSETDETSESSLSLADFAAELPLNMIESGSVETLTAESDAAGEETDELLPMVQPSSVHQLLSSLKLSHPQNEDNDKPTSSHSLSNADHESIVTHSDGHTSDSTPLQNVPSEKTQGGSTEGDLTQLDRLLLIQGFTGGDRVILEHIPDPPSASGSGQGDDNEATNYFTTFENLEGSGTSQDFHYESSGDSLEDIPQNSSAKVVNNWVAKEKHAVMSSSSRTEIPDLSEIEVSNPKIPEVKESGLPIANVEVNNRNGSLPVAETEGFPLPESLAKEENEKETEEEKEVEEEKDTEEEEKSKEDLGTGETDSEEQKAEVEPGNAASEDQPLPVADTEDISPDTESISIVAADDNQSQRQRAVPLSRESLLNNIYRLLNAKNPRPSRFTPDTRPSWAGFGVLRRRPSTAAPLPTEQTVIVGRDDKVPERPSFYQVYGSARSRREEGGSRRVRSVRGLASRPEQQESGFDAVESLRNPDDRLFRFIRSQPYPLMSALLNGWPRLRSSRLASAAVDCEWQIKTEPHLYLLVTLNNLGAPYTVNCDGAYIEVERERDGFEARWCGNRIKQSGSRPHMVFARGEVRIAVFNDGDTTDLPTGFEADVEVVDLLDARQYSTFRRSGLNFRRLGQHPVFPIW